jgi:hypothetical protein
MMNALDLLALFMGRSKNQQSDALSRIQNRISSQPDQFQDVSFKPTIADLQDYETATGGTPWPKTQVPEQDQMRMRQQIFGDPYAPINVPTEVIATPKTNDQLVQQQGRRDALGEIAKSGALAENRPQQWQTMYDQLGQFSQKNNIDPGAIDYLGNMGIKANAPAEEKEQWAFFEGPGGSRLRKNKITGKVEQVIGREPQSTSGPEGDKVPEYVKQAQQVILKFAQSSNDPMMMVAAMMRPDMLPQMKEQMAAGVPPQFKPIFDKAMSIVENYYMSKAVESGSNDPLGIR